MTNTTALETNEVQTFAQSEFGFVAEPPKDGWPYFAAFSVILEDRYGCQVVPQWGRVRWSRESNEWVWYVGGLVVRQYADAEIRFHEWAKCSWRNADKYGAMNYVARLSDVVSVGWEDYE